MRKSFVLTVAAAGLLSVASSVSAAGTWVPANVPLGGSNFAMFGINNSDVVVGNYTDSSGNEQGVVGPFDGSDWKNITDNGVSTQPRGIGPSGIITGVDTGTPYQWERSARGKLHHITRGGNDVVGGGVGGVNKSGVFVGDYTNARDIGVAATGEKYRYTNAVKTGYSGRAIDDAGDIGGWYYDSSGIQHGFVIIAGRTKPVRIDYPAAYYTVVEGMNNKGLVSGQWEDMSGVIHGFVYDINQKTYTSLDAPGAYFTQAWALNDAGVVAVSAGEPAGTESFVYCMHRTGCPGARAGILRTKQRPSARPAALAN